MTFYIHHSSFELLILGFNSEITIHIKPKSYELELELLGELVV